MYRGEFREDKHFGQGVYIFQYDNRYICGLRDGRKHGLGIRFRATGDPIELSIWEGEKLVESVDVDLAQLSCVLKRVERYPEIEPHRAYSCEFCAQSFDSITKMRAPSANRILVLLLSALLVLKSASAKAEWLVTPKEAEASKAAELRISGAIAGLMGVHRHSEVVKKSVPPELPILSVLEPDLSKTSVRSPTAIKLRFEANPPAVILPETFRARYGSLRLDITNRIRSASKITAEGIDVPEVSLPRGSHRLFMDVKDSLGRVGERLIELAIE